MDTKKLLDYDFHLFSVFALFWVFLGWLGLILAISGFFYFWIFIFYLALGIYFAISKNIFRKISKEFGFLTLKLLILLVVFSLFVTPTVFSGRDQGSFSEAAIRLSQNKQLEFSTPASDEFFRIYGPGKALNFPGFHYTQSGNLVTQFPIPYIAWLSIFYSIFGIAGLTIANVILFYLFLMSFYLIGRIYLKNKLSKLLLVLTISSFSFSWLLKFTLSENMALALLWIGILQLLIFMQNQKGLFFISAFFSFGLLIFTRIEGFAIFTMFIIAILLSRECRAFLFRRKLARIYLPVAFLTATAISTLFVNLPFFKEIGKALIKNASDMSVSLSLSDAAVIFANYGILQYVLLGIIAIIYLLSKKKYSMLLPFCIVLPVFIYLLDPNISSDHPWMLRRYVFAILPALILYSVILLAMLLNNKKKWLSLALVLVVFFINLPAFLLYFEFSENENLLVQIESISHNFTERDLVLIDRLASGNGWSMMTGPMSFLYNVNSVYFFNPSDLEKINKEKFDRIYLIVSDDNINFFKNSQFEKHLLDRKDYAITTTRLTSTESSLKLPKKETVKINGKIFEIVK
ncbi:hypothetical protein ACFLY1_00205 [Patescibacteria group bacterium]